jgi:hypothetical protein
VARYAHVDREELFEAASRLEELANVGDELGPPPSTDPAPHAVESEQLSTSDGTSSGPPSGSRRRPRRRRHGRHRR